VKMGMGAGLACALLLAPPAGAETYRDLVAAYQRGDRDAVARVGERTRAELKAELNWLRDMRRCARCGERELADRFPFLGAVLLHSERAFRDYDDAGDGDASQYHLDFALQLLEAAPPEVRAYEPKWFAAIGWQFLRRLETTQARRYFSSGTSRFPMDPSLHVGLGATVEAEVRLAAPPDVVHSSSPRFARQPVERAAERTQGLTAAEASYQRALDVQPDLAQARLRHGRVLLDLGRHDDAERDLEWVTDHVSSGGVRSLALLFRGLVREKAGQWGEAAVLYSEAVRAVPGGARASAVALAHALDHAGDVVGARAVLDALTRREGSGDPFDAYPFGPPGEVERVLGELRAAAGVK
jgi:tetratricopeptide (TPR) repeat protein